MKSEFFFAILIAVLFGCTAGNQTRSIVGKWKFKSSADGVIMKGTNEYSEGGKFSSYGTFESEDGKKVRCDYSTNGTYILGENTISYTIEEANVDCNPKELSATIEKILKDETGTDDIIELTDKVMVQRTRTDEKSETTFVKITE